MIFDQKRRLLARFPAFPISLVLLLLWGCVFAAAVPLCKRASRIGSADTIVSASARLKPLAQLVIAPHIAAYHQVWTRTMSQALDYPDGLKSFIFRSFADPWTGLESLERYGLGLADQARSKSSGLWGVLRLLAVGRDNDKGVTLPVAPLHGSAVEQAAYLRHMLRQASEQREQALQRVSREERRFLIDQAAWLVDSFIPQMDGDDQGRRQAEAMHRFHRLVDEQVDLGHLLAAAYVLLQLTDESWLQQFRRVFQSHEYLAAPPVGVTGNVLFFDETPNGSIVLGGPGANSYDLDRRIAVVIDLGGDDIYRGAILSSQTEEPKNALIVDFSGDDVYQAPPLGLATGRLGVDLLVDLSGDDVYRLSPGSGGVGLAGIGILYDGAGNDHYIGTRLTQGVGVAGLGLLLDAGGDDTQTSFGYAIGFGGPLGVGAVIDVAGDDSYQCGEHIPSNYNLVDAPRAQLGDPLFQYDCFGLGSASGIRILSKDAQHQADALAGGWGLLIDLNGRDRYRSSNFSQGMGYFYGIGLKLDLAGDDEHTAARYGYAAGAHYGLSLFIDYGGNDHYSSTGPVYNMAVAWDHSVTMGLDAGEGHDIYDFSQSDGLGRADHHGWSLFIDEGGHDRYHARRGFGEAHDGSISGFLDLAGEDEYDIVRLPGTSLPGNRKTLSDGRGGVFIDR